MSLWKQVGTVVSCGKKTGKGGPFTWFRFEQQGPIFFIAMHDDVLNHHYIGVGVTLDVTGTKVNKTGGPIFVTSLRRGKLEVTVAPPHLNSSCTSCGGWGYYTPALGAEPVMPCDECGQEPLGWKQ